METLLKQKASALKSLAAYCGISPTGTKSILSTSILNTLKTTNNNNNKTARIVPLNILSIDPGIKNFSYCKFRCSAEDMISTTNLAKPVVEEWSKINLLSKYSYLGIDESQVFTPNNFPKVVFQLCKDLMKEDAEKGKIDLVLIEQQRFRSGGSSKVLEWTLRVNMLEIMLHSILYSLNKQNNLLILSSNPRKMSNYWLPMDSENDKKKLPLMQQSIKNARIQMVNTWINKLNEGANDTGIPFKFNENISNRISKYLNSEENLKKKKSKGSRINDIFHMIVEEDKENSRIKSDDLVDSLLHGVTYYSWMNNRQLLKQRIYEDNDDDLTDLIDHMGKLRSLTIHN